MLENASMRESLLNMEKELAMLLNDRLSTDYYTPAVHTVEEEEEVRPPLTCVMLLILN